MFHIIEIISFFKIPATLKKETYKYKVRGIFITSFGLHAALMYGFVCQFVLSKNFYATSKQGRRLRFGMLNLLTKMRSTKMFF